MPDEGGAPRDILSGCRRRRAGEQGRSLPPLHPRLASLCSDHTIAHTNYYYYFISL